MSKAEKITILSLMILVGLGFSVAYHYYFSVIKGLAYPYTTFLFLPEDRFSDYRTVTRDSYTLNPYLQYKSAQYPFLIILGYLFSLGSVPAFAIFLGLFIVFFLFLSLLILREGNRSSYIVPILIICLLNYPFLFAADRGNFECILFVLLLLFLFFYARKKKYFECVVLGLCNFDENIPGDPVGFILV